MPKREVLKWDWKAKPSRTARARLLKKVKKTRITRSTASAMVEKAARTRGATRMSVHCQLEFPVRKRKPRCNPPDYEPYYIQDEKDYWRELEDRWDPSLERWDLGPPAIPLDEQEKPKYVEVKVNGNVNFFPRADEEERLAKAAKDKAKRKRRALYGGVRKRKRTKNVSKDKADGEIKAVEYVSPYPPLQQQRSPTPEVAYLRDMASRCIVS